MVNRSTLLRLGFCAALAALGCSSGKSGSPMDGPPPVVLDADLSDLPPGCPPGVANNKGVGSPCTRGGNQCTNNLFCTCDPVLGVVGPDTTPCFCTILAFATCEAATAQDPAYCGQGATCCGYRTQGSLCVPDACLGGSMCPMF